MTTTTRATKAKCLAAARRRWGKRAFVGEEKGAPSIAKQEELRAKLAALKARKDEIDVELRKANGSPFLALLVSAEFFLAVDGGEPSGTQLRNAVAEARRVTDLRDELRTLCRESDELRGAAYTYRWKAGYIGSIPGLGECCHTHASADTLDELLARIESRER